MKNKIIAFFATVLSVITLANCSGVANSAYKGAYWSASPSFTGVDENMYEKLEYEVTAITNSDYANAIVPNKALSFSVNPESKYETTLTAKDGLYVFQTKLIIKGEYTYGNGKTIAVDDSIETENLFKGFGDKFAPVKSTKVVKNTVPLNASPANEEAFVKVDYVSVIEYKDDTATVTVEPKNKDSEQFLAVVKKPVTVKKYNKKAYIENDLMALMFRNFKYEQTLSYTFNSIEDVTGALKQSKASIRPFTTTTTDKNNTQTQMIQTMTIPNCSIDGGNSYYDEKFNAVGINFQTTGEFSQTYMTAYYANSINDGGDTNAKDDENASRHVMIQCYRPNIYSTGYLVYTLHTATFHAD